MPHFADLCASLLPTGSPRDATAELLYALWLHPFTVDQEQAGTGLGASPR